MAVPSVMDLYDNTPNYYGVLVCGHENLFKNMLNDGRLYEKIKDKLYNFSNMEVDDSNPEKLFIVSSKN